MRMEYIVILLLILVLAIVGPIIGAISPAASIPPPPSLPAHKRCEARVSSALRNMDMKSYVVFDNLVLRSDGNTSHTEIDHVVVSPYGIFCIETKSHNGSIYGYRDNDYWKQYLGKKSYVIYNPFKQNYKHVRALESLLGPNLRAPIHSYVVFPNARNIKINGTSRAAGIRDVVWNISCHKTPVYSLEECEKILKCLAYASSKKDELLPIHANEVREYLSSI